MLIIGCDFHTRYQQIAMMDTLTGGLTERRLEHENGEANTFYRNLPRPVRARNLAVKILQEVRARYRFALVGYVIMPNIFTC
jgi:hypothetical protein